MSSIHVCSATQDRSPKSTHARRPACLIALPRWQSLHPAFMGTHEVERTPQRQLSKVGALCCDLPDYVQHPPIEAVVFSWGVGEDGQLVSGQ